jgi:hypothetical protein
MEIKTRRDFKCLMADRKRLWTLCTTSLRATTIIVACNIWGSIIDPNDRRRICELSKLAAGSHACWIECNPLSKLAFKRERRITMYDPLFEYADIPDKLILRVTRSPGNVTHTDGDVMTPGKICTGGYCQE